MKSHVDKDMKGRMDKIARSEIFGIEEIAVRASMYMESYRRFP